MQGKGSRYAGTSTIALLPPGAEREIPAPPSGLTKGLKEAWAEFWADPVSQMVTRADAYDVRRYFALLARREKYERRVEKAPTVLGSMGQQVVNPLHGLIRETTREIEKVREQLGILPHARMRLGIATGQAQEATARGLRAQLDARPADAPPQRRVFGKGGA